MKYLVVLAAGAILLSACGAGGGAAVADGFPPEVEARIEEERQICADGRGALEPVALEALRSAEFNADGAPDYVLGHDAFRCTEGGWMYCGSAGCSFTVFVSKPGGGLEVINMSNAQDIAITREGDRDVLDLALHGSVVGAETEYARLRWDGTSFQRQ